MKRIPLTQGYHATVDGQDYEWLNRWKWHARVAKSGLVYASRNLKTETGKKTLIGMHICIMGKKPGYVTDHIDGNGLNNCRANLRFVSRRQNQQNRHHRRTSRYPGVSWSTGKAKWRATIGVKIAAEIRCVTKHLGYYSNEQEAFFAYLGAVQHLGEDTSLLTALL